MKIHFYNGRRVVCPIAKTAEKLCFDFDDTTDPKKVTCKNCRFWLLRRRLYQLAEDEL